MTVDPARATTLFLAALDIVDPAERAAYFDRECGDDAELRERVEALLRAENASALPPAEPIDTTHLSSPESSAATEDYVDPTACIGSLLAGKYKLIEEIGEGGMGSVYMAQQTAHVKRAVAVKVIKPGMDSRAVLARFEAERQALAMMDHPNIARVLDAGTTEGGRPFFVMELVKGMPITQFCDERKLTPRQRLELFVPVCLAIQHAHQKGVIHRDIKPNNVLVALYDDNPVPKVIDFGVAKAAGQTLTEKTLMTGFGAVVGTPEYMSPEQANMNNLDVDTRSDVYSLGVLLYELLTGSTPVDRKSLGKAAVLEVLRIVREVEAPRPSEKLSTIDTLPSVAANRGTAPAMLSKIMKGELDWVLLKALEKERIRRYDTAIALAQDIQRYLADEVVEARPPGAGYRMNKFVRRHKGQVVAASLLLVALLAGIMGTSFGLVEARKQEREARRLERLARSAEQDARHNEGEAQRLAKSEAAARQNEATARKRADRNAKQAAKARQDAEVERDAARKASADSARRLAEIYFERGQRLCEQGEVPLGLHWQAKSLTTLPDESDDLENAIRLSISHWGSQILSLRFYTQAAQSDTSNCAIRADGKIFVTTGHHQKFVETWDPASGEPLGKRLQHTHAFRKARFSADGKRLITGSYDRTARIWDAHTFRPIGSPLQHKSGVASVALSPDGEIALTGTLNGMARFWNASTGEPLSDPIPNPGSWAPVDISPDSRTAIIGGKSESGAIGAARLFSLQTFQPLGKPLQTADSKARRMLFSPDSQNVATIDSMTVSMWNVATGDLVARTMKHHSILNDIAYSPNSQVLSTACDDATIQFWDAKSGARIGYPLKHHISVNSVVFVPGGEAVLSFADDGDIRLWDAPQDSPLAETIRKSQPDGAGDVHFSLRGETLLAAQGKTITLLNANTGEKMNEVHAGDEIQKLDLAGNDRTVFANISKHKVEMFNATSRTWAWQQKRDRQLQLNSIEFSHNGETILLAYGFPGMALRPNIQLLDASTGSLVKVIKTQYSLHSAVFRPDARVILAGGSEGTPRFYRVETGEQFGPAVRMHPGGVQCIRFTADSRHVITGGRDRTAKVWEAETGRVISTMLHDASVEHAAISPDGKFAITGTIDGSARFWDVRTGKPIGPPLRNSAPVRLVAFRENGSAALVAYADGLVKVWKAPRLMQGTPREIVDWVGVATGTELRDDNTLRVLDWENWHERSARLGALFENWNERRIVRRAKVH
jgi:eukaryotic-like serine/threonine-protein kinase